MNAPTQAPLPALSRVEDLRLITGRGRYTSDWNLPGQLYAHVLRSDRGHAAIKSIDTSAALGAPGVVRVLTSTDVIAAGYGPIPTGAPAKGADGKDHVKYPMPLLATDRVRFVGQPVAMVIAESARAAQDASELIVIDYDDLPAVAGMQAARAPGAPLVHDSVSGNLSLVFEAGDAAAVKAAFAKAAHITTLDVHSQRLVGAPMELRGCLASWDAATDRYTVYTPTQGMLGMRASLSAVTHIPQDRITVVAEDVGGSFGLRGGPANEQPLLMMVARELGRPVKWTASRAELFVGEWHGRALRLKGTMALDASGKILAVDWEDQADLGAYTAYFQAFIGTRNISVTMGGVYDIPALHSRQELVFTNTVPVSAYRGAGRPDIAYAIERLIDQAAIEHGFDRVELRRHNMIRKDAFPYTNPVGTVYDSGDFAGAMDQALGMADYAGFAGRRAESAARGKLRGFGWGCYIEASGAGGAPKDEVLARFGTAGQIQLFGVTGPSGQGHETSFAKIVGDGLGLSPDLVRYRASDPGHEAVGNGTGGSRSLYGAGSACKVLVGRIIEQARPHAAQLLKASPDALLYRDGAFHAGAAQIGLLELARGLPAASNGTHPLDCQGDSISGMTFPNGCHTAEVEIDPDTGVTEVVAYNSVDDLGNVISPQLVQGQVHGGVLQGAGQIFGEHAIYDEQTAQLLTGSFMDYPMPRAGWVANIRTDYRPVPTTLNALGAKGVGESGCSGSLPAIVNAMSDALRTVGVPAMDMPFTPSRVWSALQAAKKG